MRKLNISILIATFVAMLFSCTDDIDVNEIENADAMMLTVIAPTASESRAESATPSLTDGSLMQDLALFICTESSGSIEVKAYRCVTGINTPQAVLKLNLVEDDSNAANWLTDKSNNSLTATQKYSINLTPVSKGTYIIYVVANFTSNSNYADIANIIKAANGNLTADNLKNQLNLLKNSNIKIGENNLCDAKTSMPLSLRGNLQIKPGDNNHDLHLMRTYTRIKVTVRNENAHFPIKVTNLKFNKITQQNIPVFVSQPYVPAEGNLTPDITKDSEKGTDSFANTPLNISNVIAPLGTSSNEAVVFDGYVLESSVKSDDRDAKYLFDIGIQVVTGEKPIKKNTYIIDGIENQSMSDGTYLIKVNNENNYLCVDVNSNNSKATKEPLPSNLIVGDVESEKFFWIRSGNSIISKYLSETGNSNKYIDGRQYGDVTFINAERDLTADKNAIYWNNKGTSDIERKTSSITADIQWHTESKRWSYPSPISSFGFTKIDPSKTQEVTVTDPAKTIPFTFTKMVGNKSEIVRSILRNEFYNIFINVRYNENSKTFDFSVEDWNDKNLDIEFN